MLIAPFNAAVVTGSTIIHSLQHVGIMSAFDEADDSPIIGIDLGTTYSCVAAYDSSVNKVVVLPNSIGERTTPSWVAFTSTGRVVGQPAKQQASLNAPNTIYDVKRIIGRSLDDPVTREESRRFPYLIIDGGRWFSDWIHISYVN